MTNRSPRFPSTPSQSFHALWGQKSICFFIVSNVPAKQLPKLSLQGRQTTRDINNIPIKYPEGPTTFSHLQLLLCCSFELTKLGSLFILYLYLYCEPTLGTIYI